mgnify:CR=1 FL=1
MNIVIDTNVFISALMKEGITRDLIVNSQDNLLTPEFGFSEIKKYKQEILEKSGLTDNEFEELLIDLLRYVKIVGTEDIFHCKKQADEIMKDIDPDDVIFIATALACNALIWSDDEHFQKQNTIKVLKTKDLVDLR